ncbi:MAG: hypothetical protein MJZ26_14130 [Fibrobacter sp.]|nr:hypothetical protein [Fibrobacter sp.]
MKNFKTAVALFVTLLASTSYAASGAAAVVAKTAGKSYSEPTRREFLKGCQENVEAPICECVLQKLSAKYDENKFKDLERQLSIGIEDPDYVNFIVNATTECGAAYDGGSKNSPQDKGSQGGLNIAGYEVSAEEMMILMAMLQSPMLKDNFVQSCTVESMEWLGANQADKTCKCAYDRLIKDNTLLTKMLMESGDGELANFDKWGFTLVEPCLPKQFPAEMDNAFIKECMKSGDVKKATCECVLKSIKKDYNVKSLIKTSFEEPKKIELDMTLKAAQCLSK